MQTSNRQSPKPLRGYVLISVYLFIGLAISCLVIFDPYGTTYISHLVGIKLLPFTFVLLISIAMVVIFFLLTYLGKYIYKLWGGKELLFIIFYIAGYQTSALQLGIIDLSDLALGMFLLVVLIDTFVEKKKKFINTPINIFNLLLLVFILLPLVNLRGVPTKVQLMYVKLILMFFLMVNALYSKELVIKCVKWLIIIMSCTAVFAIFQEFMWITTGTLVTGMIPKEDLKRMFEGELFRVPALMLSYRIFALVLSVTLTITISFLVFPNSLVTGMKKIYLYSASLLMFGALFLTLAQDVLIGFFVALMFMLILRRPRYILHFAVVILLLATVLFSLFAYLPGKGDTISYVVRDIPKAERERIQLDRDGIQGFVWSNYKLSGRGQGGKYTDHVHGWNAHNAFILIADETGIFGFIIYIIMFVWIIYRLICLNLVVKNPAYLPITRGLLCGIIIYLTSMQFNGTYVEPFQWILFALTESTALILAKNQVPLIKREAL